jgi:hypothetical protein
MDNALTTVRVPSPRRRGPSFVVLFGAVLVALAILKPWAFGGAAGDHALPGTGITALPASAPPLPTPTSKPTAAIWDPNAMACMSSEGNRVLALLRSTDLEVRTWLTLDDASLAGSLDPGAVALRVVSSHVIGLGVCEERAVDSSSVASAAQILDVVAVSVGRTPPMTDLGVPEVITRQLGLPSLGVLYGPPTALAARPSGTSGASPRPASSAAEASWPIWPVGAYALAFRYPSDPQTLIRWVRLDIVPSVGKYN